MPFKTSNSTDLPSGPAGRADHIKADRPTQTGTRPPARRGQTAAPDDNGQQPASRPAAGPGAPQQPPARKGRPAGKRAPTPGGGLGRKLAELPLVRALGGILYTLGFSGEYVLLQIWRVLREAGALFGQLAAWLLVRIGKALLGGLRGMARDLTAPFANFRRRQRQLHRLRERERKRQQQAGDKQGKTYVGARLKHGAALFFNILLTLMPLGAAVALSLTVYTVVNLEYALAVEMDGEVLGYVADQSVVENAKGLLRDRIQLAPNQVLSDWQFSPDFSIGRAVRFTTASQLANQILRSSATTQTDLLEATGLYIDNVLYAATTEGERLEQYLEDMLESHGEQVQTGAEVSFVKQVVCDPELDEVFFGSGVQTFDELVESLNAIETQEVRYTSPGDETLAEVAYKNDLTLDTLMQRNPQYQDAPGDTLLQAGDNLLISRAKPFLQVQASVRVQNVEPIPYKTVEVETDKRQKGRRDTVQEGEDGLQQVWDDLYYIDGELARSVRVDELTTVLTPPVNEIIEVGTFDFDTAVLTGEYNEVFMFPVPNSTWSYRGKSPGHRGLDLNGPVGLPIFASNAGVVSFSGWHWSWGYNIVIDHPNGLQTRYAHCSSLAVNVGDVVKQGDYIAAMGSTGVSTGSHLHFEIMLNGVEQDPMDYVTFPEGYQAAWYRG